MKYSETKMIDDEVVKVTIDLSVDSNGWARFSMTGETFDSHIRRGEPKIQHNKRIYHLSSCGLDNNTVIEHFTHLIPFIFLNHKDTFGMPSYPIMNTMHYLTAPDADFQYGCDGITVTKEVAYEIRKYSEFHFGEFLKEHIEKVTKPLADKGINLLESLTGEKFVPTEVISAQLFNDLHYCLVTKENGWNVYQGNKFSKYSEINLVKSKV
jgi:hypothetical protein